MKKQLFAFALLLSINGNSFCAEEEINKDKHNYRSRYIEKRAYELAHKQFREPGVVTSQEIKNAVLSNCPKISQTLLERLLHPAKTAGGDGS